VRPHDRSPPPAPLVVIGDVLLDRDVEGSAERLSPDAPVPVLSDLESTDRAGGAGLAAVLAARDGRAVTLVTALARDTAGRRLRKLLAADGIEVVDLRLEGDTPEKIRVRAGGTSVVRLDRGGRAGTVVADRKALVAARVAIGRARAVLVSDYGRGVARVPALRRALAALQAQVPVVWDPHPKGPAPTPGATLVTPNQAEAERFAADVAGDGIPGAVARAAVLAERWDAIYVAVTLGARGALVAGRGGGHPLVVPAPTVAHGDPCGAGDRFASCAAGALADARLPSEAVASAVEAASRFVAAGGAAFHARVRPSGADGPPVPAGAAELAARMRAQGRTVVATGGCFDLLHAGHVRMLQRARALGDCLIVCLNSDASVRRLKGSERPLVGEDDRAEVLRGLRCVDEVAVFDEDTPERVIETLRPHVWCKGGDYAVGDLPEAALVERWGGRAVILPFLQGRSTTSLVSRARAAG
jgi:rfaE bifunctional protein nucleotidyltransferase chain/domain/rfaE bifunctional protein kinase chain/domain